MPPSGKVQLQIGLRQACQAPQILPLCSCRYFGASEVHVLHQVHVRAPQMACMIGVSLMQERKDVMQEQVSWASRVATSGHILQRPSRHSSSRQRAIQAFLAAGLYAHMHMHATVVVADKFLSEAFSLGWYLSLRFYPVQLRTESLRSMEIVDHE